MPDDLNSMFQSLRRVAIQRPLAPVTTIHRAGMRRRSMRRAAVAAACVVIAVVAAGAFAALGNGVVPVPPDPAGSSTPGPSPSSSPEPSVTGSSTATAGPNACAPQDLDARPWYAAEGAAGTAYQTVILQVRPDGRGCLLDGSPVLEGRPQTGGAVVTVPLRPAGTPGLRVSPGWYMSFTLSSPSDPARCYQRYTEVSIVMGGKRYPLKEFEASISCDEQTVAWGRALPPNDTNYATLNRAPA